MKDVCDGQRLSALRALHCVDLVDAGLVEELLKMSFVDGLGLYWF